MPDRPNRRGGRWRDHRQVIDAISWQYRTGSPWEALPAELGSGRGSTTDYGTGPLTVPGHGCSTPCSRGPTPKAIWTGSWRSTPRLSVD
ncbi:transposase [Streptomyces sp. NPDC059752]|uniref:transposase n=1 Tax=unclassified Streptomyces TaxID=2593676 RepID=UPI0036576ED4